MQDPTADGWEFPDVNPGEWTPDDPLFSTVPYREMDRCQATML